ncbi:MAG: segregation/condensation protein A [Xanthomonadales bacterium]|nr:segregation/condensation protein A [Gammaproteobacteria bacterium]MBT8054386.1 segregation/condensation protein A [Gammaproteobacteria bacterium]NND56450.1 segregation/condensation protein A [Xanthomonadales bacterium]NNK51145.1 segregation/condensation protein A [Xanthomonadales bacterium]
MVATTEQPDTDNNPPAQQAEMPFAIVQGQPLTQLPKDLYIPPDALEVFLEAFEGPLDLLLYLIRRQNLDILDIPIADITRQYMGYIALLEDLQFELAAEYLVMAAILAEIKSRMLLPRPPGDDEDEQDPRAELVRRLQEYERFKQAAENLDDLPRDGRDFVVASAFVQDQHVVQIPPEVDLGEMLDALRDVLTRADLFVSLQVQMEPLSVRERMTSIIDRLRKNPYMEFQYFFTPEEGRMGVVVTFLALMELTRERIVDIIQNEPMGQIYVKRPE